MSISAVTYLILGAKFLFEEIPQDILSACREDEDYLSREHRVKIVPKSYYEDSDLFVGVVAGQISDEDDDIIHYGTDFMSITPEEIRIVIDMKIGIDREIELFMFNQWC